ncbi:uncharacterized protein YbbC (DUF1343 family) [Prosthecobacter fusiformis]|uniref:Uncharacterized protein YbbC (DUF1343 family) n=1 Tax=Prosthecobacter fusiformis TaxID=48464 RepID=A0A4V3FFK5_9BACT|nr:exo-beta-N-acetylmuramidase NamZ domain-containing protein [Prosthecobacter fusiformis]TDU71103.1 uncharacterized protein YbbC (DUF1343 family) [Prosthecobacter fusiformis]
MRFLLLTAVLLLPSFSQAQTFNAQALQALNEVVTRAVEKKKPAGAVLWLEHGVEKHTLVSGTRALEPTTEAMTSDTVFDAASLTKVVVTAPAILLLSEQSKVDIDAPVHRYLPEFTGHGRDLIFVRHLLTHTSGLKPGIPQDPAWTGYEEGIRRALEAVPDAAPDTFFRYSDINFILLGEIVKRTGGDSLDSFAQKNLFQPLGMSSTRYLPPVEWQPRIAPTEKDANGVMLRGVVHDPTARRMGGVAGHAGLFTCAEDLAKFARMILRGGELDGVRIFKTETLERMKRVETAATIYERRGLGWDIESPYSRPRGEIFPVGSFGHTGFTGTSLWMDPYSKSFVIFLSSRLHPQEGGSVRDLYEEIGTAAAKCIPESAFQEVTGALPKRGEKEVPTVLNGIDVLKRNGFAPLNGLRVGLITNQTGIDAGRSATIDLLYNAPKVKLRALFSPEHGIRGAEDKDMIQDSGDRKTGRPIHSLYGERRAPTEEQLADLDALVFDIQDIGCRFYTYISTLRLCMEAAAKAGKKIFVLDRVNPIGGVAMEGPALVDKEAFTATHAIPIRHGMTVGELAMMMNAERGIQAGLQVIRMEGWRRDLLFDQTGLPWINPSPNMRSLEAALLYPGIGLLEFSISVGRGTDTPFEILGAPYVNDLALSHELNKLGLTGIRFMPVRFTPTASIFKDQACGGVHIQITDRAAMKPVQVGIAIATVFQRLYPKQFDLEKVNTLLNHTPLLKAVREGRNWREISGMWTGETTDFESRRAAVLLY